MDAYYIHGPAVRSQNWHNNFFLGKNAQNIILPKNPTRKRFSSPLQKPDISSLAISKLGNMTKLVSFAEYPVFDLKSGIFILERSSKTMSLN